MERWRSPGRAASVWRRNRTPTPGSSPSNAASRPGEHARGRTSCTHDTHAPGRGSRPHPAPLGRPTPSSDLRDKGQPVHLQQRRLPRGPLRKHGQATPAPKTTAMPGGPGHQEHRTGPWRGAAAWEATRAGAGGWRKVPVTDRPPRAIYCAATLRNLGMKRNRCCLRPAIEQQQGS